MPRTRFSLAERGKVFDLRLMRAALRRRRRRRRERASWDVGSGEVGRRWRGLWRTLVVKIVVAVEAGWARERRV